MEHGPDTKPLGFAVPLHRAGVEETALPPPCVPQKRGGQGSCCSTGLGTPRSAPPSHTTHPSTGMLCPFLAPAPPASVVNHTTAALQGKRNFIWKLADHTPPPSPFLALQ